MFWTVEAADDLGKDDKETFLDHAIVPSAVMGGGVGYLAASAIKEGVNLFASMFRKDKKKQKVIFNFSHIAVTEVKGHRCNLHNFLSYYQIKLHSFSIICKNTKNYKNTGTWNIKTTSSITVWNLTHKFTSLYVKTIAAFALSSHEHRSAKMFYPSYDYKKMADTVNQYFVYIMYLTSVSNLFQAKCLSKALHTDVNAHHLWINT